MTSTIDEIFIEAPREQVFDALAGIGRDTGWWQGARATRDAELLRVRAPATTVSHIRFDAHVERVRPGEGLVWRFVSGAILGHGEFWLERVPRGTIVHYFLEASPGRRSVRRWHVRVRRHRFAIRNAVNALRDSLRGAA